MKWPHWIEGCRGPVIRIEHIYITKLSGTLALMENLGWNTKQICKCRECGQIFEAASLPGKWTLEEIRNKDKINGETEEA